jgi:hypothetical protein
MKVDFNELKQEIKESGNIIYWYDKNGKILLVDTNKSSSKKKINKLDYNGMLYRLVITFHSGTKYGQGGVLAVNCRTFNKETSNKITKVKGYKNGIIWFTREWLERRGWNEKYLMIIVKKLIGSLEFKISINLFQDLI